MIYRFILDLFSKGADLGETISLLQYSSVTKPLECFPGRLLELNATHSLLQQTCIDHLHSLLPPHTFPIPILPHSRFLYSPSLSSAYTTVIIVYAMSNYVCYNELDVMYITGVFNKVFRSFVASSRAIFMTMVCIRAQMTFKGPPYSRNRHLSKDNSLFESY